MTSCASTPDDMDDPDPQDPTGSDSEMPPQDPTPETPTQAVERVITQWQQCMQLADFQASNMAGAWSGLQTQQALTCQGCHATAAGGFIATAQAEPFFNLIQMQKYLLIMFVIPDLSEGTGAAKMIVNVPVFERVATGSEPHAQHPRFAFPDNAGMTALRDFHARTMARINAGGCGLL
ncbi:MAG TPA: hypothetical protein VIV11_40610 [Kofleriaceae bacterium]